MATTPLVVGGVFSIGATDYSDAVTHVALKATADEIEVPATLATPKSSRKGGVKYEIEINYLSNDLATELFTAFWDALQTADGELDFTLSMRDGVTSATNPEWSGTFVVLAAALGGDAEDLSQDSVTFPLTAAPDKATA